MLEIKSGLEIQGVMKGGLIGESDSFSTLKDSLVLASSSLPDDGSASGAPVLLTSFFLRAW